jgi:anthranilate synthase/aminodeoxychorismate synthase-like glutamine amidotransferase
MPHVLLIDNYDSFTYNLYQALAMLGAEVTVARNDAISVDQARELKPTHLMISPGPGTPGEAGISGEMIKAFHAELPVLGVCLGHQTLAAVFGATVGRAQKIVHGKTSPIIHDRRGLYLGIPSPFHATRYHSLVVEEEGLPSLFEISSYTSDGEIMGIRIKGLPVEGVQFHPESILTTEGQRMMSNFIQSGGKA